MKKKSKSFLTAVMPAMVLAAASLFAQPGYYFGQNKVHYKNFDWKIFRTEHFDVHYYTEEAGAAHDAARMAERGYDYLSEVLEHKIEKRIPLVLYASLNDFQQTNVVQEMLGDGTRGVTESLKHRVALPITGSYREFNHVLVHELVHAFQFDIIFNGKSRASLGRFDPPLWFMEGMAEYLSIGMDNATRMWVRDGLLAGRLLSVEKLNGTYDIRVYRLGESLWNFVGETYGKKKVGQIFKTAVNFGNVERAFKAQIDMDFKQLTTAWHQVAPRQALSADSTLRTPEQIAQQITSQEGYFHRMNLVPAASPDGKRIVYVSNKNLTDEIYLLEQKRDGKFEKRRLIRGGQSRNFESLRFFDTTINWARDGSRIAFVSKSGKDDAIYVMDPASGGIIHKLTFAELNGLVSPSFSPKGDQLVFVGISGGRSDLYTVDLADKKLRRLTQDRFAELHPQWSPDGKTIVFATDRGAGTDESKLLFGDNDLAVYRFATKEITLLTELSGDAINPQWSPDGSEIAFVSDHQGIPNIYRLNLATKEITPITMLKTGVAGITETTPAMSWSADGRMMVFSSFVKGSWQLFRMELASGKLQVADCDLPTCNLPWLPAIPDFNNSYTDYNLASPDSIESRQYSSTPKLDGIALGALFGGYFGTVGGLQFSFSDMMSNHNIVLSLGLTRDIRNTDLGVGYLNQARRLGYGFETFQQRNAFGVFAAPTANGFVTQTYRGINGFGYYPFSRFSRFEVSAGLTHVSQDFVVERVDFSSGRIRRDKLDLGGVSFGQVGAALVYDNTTYGPIGPISGRRSRIEIQRATNDLKFTTVIADYRKYFNVNNRSVLAYRLLGGASFDRDAQVFRIGGAYTFRGTDRADLLGTNFLVQNLEYRFPLLPFLPPTADFLSGVAFADAAAAWGIDVPGLVKEKFQPFSTEGGFHLQDLRGAFGLGARLNLGYLSLRYDVAWPTDLKNVSKPVKMFSIGADF
ncbi:MAG: DPP IV N-terminal domain-containing protein [candidate division KSB1 bacterium]|nr:DPP IV N-terminal domain-containing protein [candidate division KSB1 bacterium]MDZ7365780.1 DPP IV N-terminal domain-containing protein [candidate division KSB1 bacterium]MDZ7403741.1 DPP IV N-terminal domain-containing protein [candidate division KSB1 bacterium]